MATQVNGINLDMLKQTVELIKADPELARCQFRATNRWLGGNRSVGSVKTFYAARQEMEHQQPFETHADEPSILAGDDSAANPVEQLLTALAACLTTSMVAHAAVRGIQIEELESEVEGDIDLSGYLGLAADVPNGYQQIRVKFKVKSDADAEQLEQLASFSPVFHTIAGGAPIELHIDRQPMAGRAEAPEQPSASAP